MIGRGSCCGPDKFDIQFPPAPCDSKNRYYCADLMIPLLTEFEALSVNLILLIVSFVNVTLLERLIFDRLY